MRKQLTLIMALFVIVLVALLCLLTIGEREISSEAIEEILASRSSSKSEVPDVSHTLLKGVTTAITQEIDKTDDHRRDRVDDLLVALEESPSLQRILTLPNLTALEEELYREDLKRIINWFLTTDPPSPEQRRQIEAQIDQIISMTSDYILGIFPESKALIEEMVGDHLTTSLMERYNDALTPSLKRPLSPDEMEAISLRLAENGHELKDDLFDQQELEDRLLNEEESHRVSNSHLEGLRQGFTHFAIHGLFLTVKNSLEDPYRLPMTERLIELSNAVHEEFVQREQARVKRISRMAEAWSKRMREEALKDMEAYDKAQMYGVDLQENVAPIEAGYKSESMADIRNPSDGTLFPVGDRQPSINPGDDNVDSGNPPAPPNAGMRLPMKEHRNLNPLEEDVTDFTDRQFELLLERLQSLPTEASEKAFESDEAFEKVIRERQSREFRQPPPAELREENPSEEETSD